MRLMPAAFTSTTTSSGFGVGTGRSSTRSTSAGPCSDAGMTRTVCSFLSACSDCPGGVTHPSHTDPPAFPRSDVSLVGSKKTPQFTNHIVGSRLGGRAARRTVELLPWLAVVRLESRIARVDLNDLRLPAQRIIDHGAAIEAFPVTRAILNRARRAVGARRNLCPNRIRAITIDSRSRSIRRSWVSLGSPGAHEAQRENERCGDYQCLPQC